MKSVKNIILSILLYVSFGSVISVSALCRNVPDDTFIAHPDSRNMWIWCNGGQEADQGWCENDMIFNPSNQFCEDNTSNEFNCENTRNGVNILEN
jgi:hypothetical protein